MVCLMMTEVERLFRIFLLDLVCSSRTRRMRGDMWHDMMDVHDMPARPSTDRRRSCRCPPDAKTQTRFLSGTAAGCKNACRSDGRIFSLVSLQIHNCGTSILVVRTLQDHRVKCSFSGRRERIKPRQNGRWGQRDAH